MLRFQKVFLSHLEAENKHMVIINRINRNVWGTMWQSFIVTWSSIAQYPYVKIFGAIWLWNYHCLRYKTVSHFCEITRLFLCPKKFTKVNRHKKNCTSNCSLTLLLNEIKILKIWGTFLLPPVSYLKHIFHPKLASHYCQDIGLQNQVTRSFSNQKWNEFLKITI